MSTDLQRLKSDYRLYFRRCLKIRDKLGRIVPFEPNQSQERLIDIVEDWWREYPRGDGPTLYIIILKARQIGFSTCTEAIFFHDLHFGQNMAAMVVSYDEDSASNINDMSERFYRHLPQFLKPMSRPARGKGLFLENPKFNPAKPVDRDNDPGLQSKFLIETAGNVAAGSSYTLNRLHISELAKWPNPEATMTSLMQAVPDRGAIVVVESTANGMNYFQELWDRAEKGENNYIPVFVPWFEHPDYVAPFDGTPLSKYEKEIQDAYSLSLEQIQWRRNTIKDKLNCDERLFKQEYPCCPEEAFLTTGTPVFDNEKVILRKRFLEAEYKKNPPLRGNLRCLHDRDGDPVPGTEVFEPDPHGFLTIYEPPQKGIPYVIGGDTAEGGEDKCCGQVLNNVTGRQAATWHGRTDTDLFAKAMFSLGHWYNKALIGIEMNFDLHPVKELERLEYPKQYMREIIDSVTNQKQKKHGWNTTPATRGPLIGDLVAIVRDSPELVNDITTLAEMLTFVRNSTGKPEALQGKFDDCVMALAIAHKIRDQQSMKPEPTPEERRKRERERRKLTAPVNQRTGY